jgi:hypothetical protein
MYDDLLKEIYGEVYDTPEKRATFDAERDYLRELLYNDPNNPGMKMRDNIDTINKLEAQRSRDLFSIHDTPIPEGPAFNAKEMFKQDLANALSLRSDELQAMSVPEVYEQMVLNYLKTLSRLGVSSREPEAGEIIRKISYVMTTNSFNEGERNEELRDLFKAWVDIADWNIVVDYSSSAKDLAQGSFRINPEKIQNLTNQKEELTIEIKKNDGTTESRVMTIGMGDFQDKLNEEKWSSLVFAEKGEDAGFVQHQNPQVMSERRNLLILETIQDKLDLKPGDEILSVNDIVSHKDSSGNQVSPTEYLCNEIRWAENLAYGMYQSLDKPRYNLRFTGSLKDWMGKVYQFVEYFAKYKIGPRIIGDRLRLGMTGLKEYVYGSIMSPYEEVFSPKVEANDQNGRKKFDVEINSYTKLSMRAKTAVEAIIFKMTHETETMGKNGWMRSFDETYNRLVKKQNITDKEIQVLNNYTDWSKSIKEIVAQGALVPGAQINYQGQQVYVTDLPKMGASIEKLNLSPEEVYFPEEMGRGVEGMKTFYKHMSHNYLKWNSAAKDSIGKYYGYVINADAIRGQILSGADGVALVPTFSALKKIVGQFGYLDNADQFRKIHRVIVGICQLRRGHLGLPFIGSPLEYFSHTLRNYNKADAAERAKIEQEAREGKIIICGNGDTIDQNGVLQYYKVKKSYLRGLQDVGKYFFDVEGTDRELKGRGEDKNMTAYGEAEPDLAEAMRQGAANVAGQKAVKPESERWKTVKDPLGIVSALKGKGNVGKERGWRDITEEDIDMMYHYLNQNLMTGYSRKKIASVAKEAKTSWQRTPMREIAQPILGPSKWIGEALIGR